MLTTDVFLQNLVGGYPVGVIATKGLHSGFENRSGTHSLSCKLYLTVRRPLLFRKVAKGRTVHITINCPIAANAKKHLESQKCVGSNKISRDNKNSNKVKAKQT